MPVLFVLLVIAVFWLAYSNGANDNFKGVATLHGSGTTFRRALAWATAATVLGSGVSVFAAATLLKAFSGKGLVPDTLAKSPVLFLSVGAAAAVTILLATYLGMPASTTHALTGALVGSALVATGRIARPDVLLTGFAQPLLISPLVAVAGAALLYSLFRMCRREFGITPQTCVCIENAAPQPIRVSQDGAAAFAASGVSVYVDDAERCVERYQGGLLGIKVQPLVDLAHYASGAAVCFSRAVNDTPKIAALLFASGVVGSDWKLALVAVAMAAGGLLNSRKVAETMSKRITELSPGQGLSANLTTAAVVLSASHLGLPVSTTHVACGSIFGIGLVNKTCQWKTMAQILVAWITTLPLAAGLGALLFWAMSTFGRG
jgi:inorganic phosphate transporter, PiT family